MSKKLTHIVGTFLIKAEGAFLNGSISEMIDGYKGTTPKLIQEFNNKIPYVSAQAWRHWLRETYKEEYPNDPTTPIETTGIDTGESKDKYTTKEVGTNIDPVLYAEHDIFGYMAAKEGQGSKGVKATIRSSPFQSSILLSVRKSGWEGIDKGFVYPKSVAISLYREILDELTGDKSKLSPESKKEVETLKSLLLKDISREELVEGLSSKLKDISVKEKDEKGKSEIELAVRKITLTVPTSLPYTTRFYNTHLQGIFGLAYHRVGIYRNAGDREELEAVLTEKYENEGKIERIPSNDKNATIYKIKDKKEPLERTKKILRSLAVLRGGAKQAQFGADVSPKVMIVAGLTCGNLIFNDLFEDTKEMVTNPREQTKGDRIEVVESKVMGGTRLKIDTLKQIISDYADRIVTPVYIGIRNGYLSRESENDLREWTDKQKKEPSTQKNSTTPEIDLCSPIEAVEKLLSKIEELEK
jgi:CRISPR/Cas system-associated protein Cas7 (RAMP superfamily)